MGSHLVRNFIEWLKTVFSFDAAGALIAVAALLPFERIGAFSVAGVSVRPSQVALLIALAFAARGFFRRERFPAPPRLLGWLVVFFAVAALSILNAANASRSLMVLAFSVFTASLAFLLPRFLSSTELLRRTRIVILISAGIVGLFGLWQFLGDMAGLQASLTGLRPTYSKAILGFTRIQSTALEPLYFADYLLLPLGLALAWLMTLPAGRQAARTSKWLWALVGLLAVNLFLTSSRGGYGGCIAMLFVLIWSYRHEPAARRIFGRFLGIAVGAIFLSLMFLSVYALSVRGTLSDTFITHVTTLTDGAAWAERLETSFGALDAFRLHPWIGIGFGSYGPWSAVLPYRMPDTGWAIVNNEYLELLAETGAIGLALFLTFLISVAVKSSRPRNIDRVDAIRIGALAALAGMMVQYLTFSTLYVMHIWFTIGLVLAASSLKKSS